MKKILFSSLVMISIFSCGNRDNDPPAKICDCSYQKFERLQKFNIEGKIIYDSGWQKSTTGGKYGSDCKDNNKIYNEKTYYDNNGDKHMEEYRVECK